MPTYRDQSLKVHQELTTSTLFLENYNKGIPVSYPQASQKDLQQFRTMHPNLFKTGDMWSIEKHRKRLMDWLSSHRDTS